MQCFGQWADVRPVLAPEASEGSMTEPDFAVVPKAHVPGRHPRRAMLLIEVAHSSLRLDRAVKAPLYAEGGSSEYWIIDVAAAKLEVFRAPLAGQWTEHFTLAATEYIRAVAFPEGGDELQSAHRGLGHEGLRCRSPGRWHFGEHGSEFGGCQRAEIRRAA
jgi:Uma2 family endonuclease